MGERLTEAQMSVLRCVANHPLSDGTEIGQYLGHVSYWASPKLKRLRELGLIDRLGQSFRGGYCHTITDAGRSLLKENPNG